MSPSLLFLCAERNLTVERAARACRVSEADFARTVDGELVRPSTALKIARFFDVPVADLLWVPDAA